MDDERISTIVQRHLKGERASTIAQDLGISRARVYQLIQDARASGQYSVHVQVQDAHGVELADVAVALKRVLAMYGLNMGCE